MYPQMLDFEGGIIVLRNIGLRICVLSPNHIVLNWFPRCGGPCMVRGR